MPLLITNSNIFVSNIDQMFLLHLYKTVLNTPLKKYEYIQKKFYYCVYVAETKISMRKFFLYRQLIVTLNDTGNTRNIGSK